MRIRTLSLVAACLVTLMLSVGGVALVTSPGGDESAGDQITRTSAVDRVAGAPVRSGESATPSARPTARLPFASGLMATLESVVSDPVGAARAARSDLRASDGSSVLRPDSTPTEGRTDGESTGDWTPPSGSPSTPDPTPSGESSPSTDPSPSDPPSSEPSEQPSEPEPTTPEPAPESDPGLIGGVVDGLTDGLGLS